MITGKKNPLYHVIKKIKIQSVFTIEHVHVRQFITFSNQYDTKLYYFFAFKHPVILSSSNCSYLIPKVNKTDSVDYYGIVIATDAF